MTPPDASAPVFSFREAADRATASARVAHAMRQRIETRDGGRAAFRQAIRFEPIEASDATALREFHALLAQAILPRELVPLGDFAAALGPKNTDPAVQAALGPYRYVCLAARTDRDGLIGAAGFATFCHCEGPATLHASYYALRPEFRGFGLGRRLLQAAADTAVAFAAAARPDALAAGPILHFIETTAYAHMTLAERLWDEAAAIHPLARDTLWEAIGFREIMNIGYRQRTLPPGLLTLKALLIQTGPRNGKPVVTAFVAPDRVSGDVIHRHVTAFDSLLLNNAATGRALAAGRPAPDAFESTLLARFPPGVALSVLSPDDAARQRQAWFDLEDHLRAEENRRLAATMRTLSATAATTVSTAR